MTAAPLIGLVLAILLPIPHRQAHRHAPPLSVARPKGPGRKRLSEATPADVAKEKHLFFDEVSLSVRGGHGGRGDAFNLPKAGKGAKIRRTADGDFDLPEGGGRGGSVILEVDTALQDLLHLHGRPLVAAPHGADSAGLNQYRKVQRMQKEASILANVDLGEHDGEKRGNVRANPN